MAQLVARKVAWLVSAPALAIAACCVASSPSATALQTSAPPGSTTTTLPTVPPTNALLADMIPTVEGYTVTAMPPDNPLWLDWDLTLPSTFTRHHALVLGPDGQEIARVVVAAAASGDRSTIDTFVEHTFATQVMLPLQATANDGGIVLVENSAGPEWQNLEDNAVIVAEQEEDGNFQWAWGAEDVVWIVRGTSSAEAYVRALLQRQASSLDPFDDQGMTGELLDRRPAVPGNLYTELPRSVELANVSATPLRNCVERFVVTLVTPSTVGEANLLLALAKIPQWCIDIDVPAQVEEQLAAGAGPNVDQIGGLTTYRSGNVLSALVGDVLIVLTTDDPQNLVAMAPFIDAFLAAQPR
jgi:hypothetical protein